MKNIAVVAALCTAGAFADPYNHPVYKSSGTDTVFSDLNPVGLYLEADTGLGFQSLESNDLTEVSSRFHLGIGLKLYELLYVGGGVNAWVDYEADDETEEEKNSGTTFSGVSTGLDARLHLLPTPSAPYVRFGHHCWSASVGGLLNPWEKEGCSYYWGLGLNITGDPSPGGHKTSLYGEILQMSFEDVEAINLVLGFRL